MRVARGVRISIARGAQLVLEDGCSLGERCRIDAAGGVVRIGRDARIGERAVLVAVAGIEIGAGADVGDWVLIADAEPTFAERPAPISIGDGARLGLHAAVLAGADVAAGETLTAYETRAPRRSA